MYATAYINNEPRVTCYICNGAPGDGRDMLHLNGMEYPYDYICTTCLAEKLTSGDLVLRSREGDVTECDECGANIEADGSTYCWSCYESASDTSDELNTCDECGSDDAVYCVDHAMENWNLVGKECDDCDSPNDVVVLCETHIAARTQPATAAAAEAIEVDWS